MKNKVVYKIFTIRNLLLVIFLLIISISYGQTLYLYGGTNHDVFLGCINCEDYSSSSIWNEYSEYGSNYSSTSIWNEYSDYGSEYSTYSPWNEYASYPPVIVDSRGNFYGYLTTNEYHAKRARSSLALLLCKYYDLIREDVSVWYKKIFE